MLQSRPGQPILHAPRNERAQAKPVPARSATRRDLCAQAVTEIPFAFIALELGASATAPADARIAALAAQDELVLLRGPAASGKTRMACRLHALSPRREGPLLDVQLRALGDGLVEAAIFGQLPGCHCCSSEVAGVLERAYGGTVVLNDVELLTPCGQAKLLHLVRTGEYHPLGAARPKRSDVRIVATTTRDLATLPDGRFRAELLAVLAAHEIVLA